ncbi:MULTISPECIES: inositol monophosphatase family protein [Sphingomonas]|uniref:inositol monophosphatase family protein n=1 Tax=Sphingomonas TaxID=13687 RepID=UPI000DF0151D|nr:MULTISPECIES: inositol monophosphatase [Sphingomonas]
MNIEVLDKVSTILREVADSVLLRDFRPGKTVDGWEKSAGEIVTKTDRLAEATISRRLRDLRPHGIVIGEEAVATRPELLSALSEPLVWLLDPLDGTRNFARGEGPFATMLCLLAHGQPVAAWILDPLTGRLVVAERGAGAWDGATRLRCRKDVRSIAEATAIVSDAFVPAPLVEWVAALRQRLGAAYPTRRCAGAEYPLLADGSRDLIVYWRTLPWDHAAGTLLVEEAGGAVRQLDGSPYRPATPRPGLVAAASEELLEAVLAFTPD